MTEIKVQQRSAEWFACRKDVLLTASSFGDALGVGKGRAVDYLLSRVSDDPAYSEAVTNPFLQHGISMEVIIREAYHLLTGYRTRESGFWIPGPLDTMMKGVIGASPDDLVINNATGKEQKVLGLVEYKAPVFQLYSADNPNTINGIPRQYMAQIQGQMGVTGTPWCDFMAVCVNTKQLILKRVFFSPKYWYHVSTKIQQFSLALKASRVKKKMQGYITTFSLSQLDEVTQLEKMTKTEFFGENEIKVKSMVEVDEAGRYCGPSGKWLSLEFLLGSPIELSPELQTYANKLLTEVDEDLRLAQWCEMY